MNKSIFNNTGCEYIFILCPFWVGGLYFLLINIFPEYHIFVYSFYLFFLGETHFGATWLFFNNKNNWPWVAERSLQILIIPGVALFSFILISIWSLPLGLFIASAMSAYHVVRQSIGINRLYGGLKYGSGEIVIYAASVIFLGVGFLRFYGEFFFIDEFFLTKEIYNIAIEKNLQISVTGFVFLVCFCFYFYKKYHQDSRLLSASFTGGIMYFPYCFVDNMYDAIAVGVGMHWCQYLAINGKAYFLSKKYELNNVVLNKKWAIIFIVLYAFIMSNIETYGWGVFRFDNMWILIPLCGQFLHYYVDAFIWRFSDPHIRREVGGPLFAR